MLQQAIMNILETNAVIVTAKDTEDIKKNALKSLDNNPNHKSSLHRLKTRVEMTEKIASELEDQ